jgi:transposase InsO family protein
MSMSKKSCSPDNAACEGFFGCMKNESFYNHSFKGYNLQMFIDYLNGYIKWYNKKRVKDSLGFCSPMEFRQIYGYATSTVQDFVRTPVPKYENA